MCKLESFDKDTFIEVNSFEKNLVSGGGGAVRCTVCWTWSSENGKQDSQRDCSVEVERDH